MSQINENFEKFTNQFDLAEFDSFVYNLSLFSCYKLNCEDEGIEIQLPADDLGYCAKLDCLIHDLNKINQYCTNLNITPKFKITDTLQVIINFEKQLLKGYTENSKDESDYE